VRLIEVMQLANVTLCRNHSPATIRDQCITSSYERKGAAALTTQRPQQSWML